MPFFRIRSLPLASVIACASLAGAVHAETSPWYVGAGIGQSHDSNVFRAPEGSTTPPVASDSITSLTLLGGLDQPIGRQRVYGSLALHNNRFRDNSQLNNTSYDVDAALDWSTVGNFSGTVRVLAEQNLAHFNPGDAPQITARNIERTQQESALFRLGGVTRLTFEGGLTHSAVNYSASEFDFLEFHQDAVSAGVRYEFSGALNAGAALRYTNGRYPRFQQAPSGDFIGDSYTRRDLDLTANWIPTGNSTVNARVSFGRTKHDEAFQQNVSGVTGSLSWDWRPTGKLRFETALIRDTGQDSTFQRFFGTPITSQTDTSRLTRAIQTNATYAATAKITLAAGLGYNKRDLTDTQALSVGTPTGLSGTDHTTTGTLGVRWTPTRTSLLRCDYSREKRSTDTTLSQPYSDRVAGCSAQITLQ